MVTASIGGGLTLVEKMELCRSAGAAFLGVTRGNLLWMPTSLTFLRGPVV
jgi:hypothetical protein